VGCREEAVASCEDGGDAGDDDKRVCRGRSFSLNDCILESVDVVFARACEGVFKRRVANRECEAGAGLAVAQANQEGKRRETAQRNCLQRKQFDT
jgi:hypothetical protein